MKGMKRTKTADSQTKSKSPTTLCVTIVPEGILWYCNLVTIDHENIPETLQYSSTTKLAGESSPHFGLLAGDLLVCPNLYDILHFIRGMRLYVDDNQKLSTMVRTSTHGSIRR